MKQAPGVTRRNKSSTHDHAAPLAIKLRRHAGIQQAKAQNEFNSARPGACNKLSTALRQHRQALLPTGLLSTMIQTLRPVPACLNSQPATQKKREFDHVGIYSCQQSGKTYMLCMSFPSHAQHANGMQMAIQHLMEHHVHSRYTLGLAEPGANWQQLSWHAQVCFDGRPAGVPSSPLLWPLACKAL